MPFIPAFDRINDVKTKTLTIAIFLNRQSKGSNDQVTGILNYSARCENWNIHILSRPATKKDTEEILNSLKPDGIIAGSYSIVQAFRKRLHRRIPSIVIDCHDKDHHGANGIILCADHDIGKSAAEFFIARDFKNFAFAGIHCKNNKEFESFNSINRENGFKRALKKSGDHTFSSYSETLLPGAKQYANIKDLAAFLHHLPKPCALLAYSDAIASSIIKSCIRQHISVPMQIAVLGVNNDVSVCENSSPTISSIDPDFVQAGYKAAQCLDQLIKNNSRKNFRLTYHHKGIVERMSTSNIAGNRNRVVKALEMIRTRATEGISVKEISAASGVSVRMLELSFREAGRESIREEIINERLSAAKELIKNSKLTSEEIAKSCGFKTIYAFRALLKKRTGKSIRQWRSE